VEFDLGTGFTSGQRRDLWVGRGKLKGKLVKYKFQPTGVKDKPRFPVFIGFRDARDL
jgi:DNA ligase-1